jgi:uncharacterized protein (TIGR03083 family)
MDLPYDALDVLQTNGVAFIDLVSSADPDLMISACPGWRVSDLANHQAEVWNFWAHIVADGITERTALRAIQTPARVDGPELVDWLAATHNALFSALVDAPLDQPAWTWTGATLDAAWVRRRMALESAMHRHDLASTVRVPYDVPTVVAADGIDEFLTYFCGRERREGEMKVGGTVHLHCTDMPEGQQDRGEWYISNVKEPSCTFTREHRKGDAAVRGPAQSLWLWLWRRDKRGDDSIEVIGKEEVARRFRAYTDLD